MRATQWVAPTYVLRLSRTDDRLDASARAVGSLDATNHFTAPMVKPRTR